MRIFSAGQVTRFLAEAELQLLLYGDLHTVRFGDGSVAILDDGDERELAET